MPIKPPPEGPVAGVASGPSPIAGGRSFSLDLAPSPPLPVLIAVPHAGREYPPALLENMRDPEWSQLRLEDRLVDLVAREIAKDTGAGLLIAHAPRAMIDLNRATDDIDWSMVTGGDRARPVRPLANRRARSGLGLVPRRLPGLGEIWKAPLERGELERRVANVHRPYHVILGRSLERIRDMWGAALLIDLHSMPPLKTRGEERPAEFVIGDRFGASCDHGLVANALNHLGGAGRRVAHNRPYSGGDVLDAHATPRRSIHAIQLEICRSTYLDARLDQPGPRLASVARLLAGLVRELGQEVAARGDPSSLGLAAQ